MWDVLPSSKDGESSVLRLDHIMPVGQDPAGYELTEWALSDQGLALLDDWISWLVAGGLSPALYDLRSTMAELFSE